MTHSFVAKTLTVFFFLLLWQVFAFLLLVQEAAQPAQPSDWKIVFDSRRDGKSKIYIMDPDGYNSRRLTHTEGVRRVSLQPVWSPDRTQIAFSSNRDGKVDVYLMEKDGSNVRRITRTEGQGRASRRPVWSPDGTRIAFHSNRDSPPGPDIDSEYEIYVMQADGSHVRRLTHNQAADLHPDWSPDGKRLLFTSDRSGHSEIYAMRTDGSEVHQLTKDRKTAARAAWSPDGKRIAFMSNRDAQREEDENGFEIYLMDADGSNVQRLTRNQKRDSLPRWSPDGKQIVFQSGTRGPEQAWSDVEIYIMKADGSQLRRLTFNEASDMHADW